MTIEIALAIFVVAAYACFLVYNWQEKLEAPPPYATPGKCTQNCNQGRDCTCFQQSCDQTVEEFSRPKPAMITPNAAWPFPTSKP